MLPENLQANGLTFRVGKNAFKKKGGGVFMSCGKARLKTFFCQ